MSLFDWPPSLGELKQGDGLAEDFNFLWKDGEARTWLTEHGVKRLEDVLLLDPHELYQALKENSYEAIRGELVKKRFVETQTDWPTYETMGLYDVCCNQDHLLTTLRKCSGMDNISAGNLFDRLDTHSVFNILDLTLLTKEQLLELVPELSEFEYSTLRNLVLHWRSELSPQIYPYVASRKKRLEPPAE